ncbi:MAG: hypothetical protein HWD59_10275 [Coxiellaceae bacterium]|nr:MAG: hypothetical protein HWD59_10275 [Coxiellaceae bacterium]
MAVHLRNIKMIKLLVEIMRSRGIPLIHRDLDDKTALDLAQNDPEILQLLTASAPGHSFKISNMNPAPPPKKHESTHYSWKHTKCQHDDYKKFLFMPSTI